MLLTILDETLEDFRRAYNDGILGGDVVGRVLDTEYEGHIYVAGLMAGDSGQYGRYSRIGRWEIHDLSGDIIPSGDEDVEIFISPNSDNLAAFYQGHRIEDVHVAKYRTDFTARIAGIVDCELLAGKTVFIIGAGSVGSQMGMHLVRAGVARFTIVDFDTVEAANLCRCEYSVDDIGRYKTFAMRNRLLGVNPYVQVETLQVNMMEIDDDELLAYIERADLVVSAADDNASEHKLNALAHSITPVVYPALYSRASAGEVIFTVPGGPCYQCITGGLRSVSDAPSKGDWDYTTAGALKAEPGLGVDISHVVVIASKVALSLLLTDARGADTPGIIDRNRNLIFVSNVGQEMYGVAFEPFGAVWAETQVNYRCHVCHAKATASNSESLSRIREIVSRAKPVELSGMITSRDEGVETGMDGK